MKTLKIIAIGMAFLVGGIFIAGVMDFAIETFAPDSYMVLLIAAPILSIYLAYLIYGGNNR